MRLIEAAKAAGINHDGADLAASKSRPRPLPAD
jgi:hypothetical protein